LILAVLVFLVALLLVIFTATNLLTSNESKDLAAAVLSPVVAVTGTALGFYFGGRSSTSGSGGG
jgi:amino acid permease